MPRRQQQFGKPLRRRGKAPSAPSMPVTLKGRHAKALTRELIKANQQPNKTAAQNDALARTGAWRFRRHLAPFGWLGFLLLAGGILPATTHPLLFGIIAGIIGPVLLVLFTRHLPRFAKHAAGVAAMLTSLWLPFLAALGLRACLPALLITWAICTGLWVRHYRWRPARPAEVPGDDGDIATWRRLAEEKRWHAELSNPENIPGGIKYQIRTDGIKTHIGQIMTEPRAIPAAWHRPRTEAYAEPHPSAIESWGVLTLLNEGTLEPTVQWDGKGFDEHGIARVGRFGDSQPMRIRVFIRRNGTVHGLIAGTTGAGKTQAIDLLVWLALNSAVPIVPIILDPQNGQSLPQWRDKVMYAAGLDECVRMVRGMDAAMMDRSKRLASMTWDDNGHKAKGMNFFDPHLSGLPIVMPIFEEAPELLKGGGNPRLAAEMTTRVASKTKLARKSGESVWLVAQVPSLAELGGDQALRAMLAGGNVLCMRTAERVSAGMIGLDAEPSSLPRYFPDGQPTPGLSYAVGLDNRQAPGRIDLVPDAMRHQAVTMPLPDDGYLEAMDKAMGGDSPTATVAPITQPSVPEPVAEAEPDGRRCVDAVWKILDDSGSDMDRGVIIADAGVLATSEWGRAKPFTVGAVRDALRDLVDGKHPGRKVIKPAGARPGVYRAVPAGQEQEQGAA